MKAAIKRGENEYRERVLSGLAGRVVELGLTDAHRKIALASAPRGRRGGQSCGDRPCDQDSRRDDGAVDAVLEGLTAGGDSPWGEGQLAHYAGPAGDDAIVVDIWESREHFDRFMNERLGAQLGAAGVPQPDITEFEVHNQM